MKTQLRKSALTLAVAACLGASGAVYATETSSAVRGKITTPAGEAAANVKIKLIHEPSGTVTEYTTNDAGAFLAKGLRVGGPYTVIIDSDKYKDITKDRIYLSLGQTSRISEQLEPLTMETIQVTGVSYTQQAGGANSAFGAEIIENAPSFNRDIKDIARINPLATVTGSGELTIAGNNPRTNALTVDGISQNDDFGLNFSGYPSQQPPVSLDAIEQVTVDFAPFSASKGNFGGGTINAVTKSGTNEFKFSGYYETSTPDMAGDVDRLVEIKGQDERTYETEKVDPIQTEARYGFSVGGPIIKDKLFFFANYTSWRSELEMDYGFEGSGATHLYNTTEENFNRFLSILETEYGMTDSLGGDPEDTNDTLISKITWNINDAHRLDFTYQWQDDQDERNFGNGGDTVMLASNRYTYVNTFNNFATKIYSDWNDDFSSEISVSHKDVTAESNTNSKIGSVKVEEYFRGPAYQFGMDQYRHANYAENQNTALAFDGTYLLGDHEIKFGAKYERLRLYNLFAANSLGSWEFDSFDGFANREVGNFRGSYDFDYANAYTNDSKDTAYDATRSQIALYSFITATCAYTS
ncbi:MAG: TonB-dependent receptor, partial [Pseudoalteromonas spongiae]